MSEEMVPVQRIHLPANGEAQDHIPALAWQRPALPEISKALAAVQAKCGAAHLDKRNDFQRFDYASAESVIKTAQDALGGSGLSILCRPPRLRAQGSPKAFFYMERQITLMHTSGEYLDLDPLEWPVVEDKGRPLDKAFAIAITTSLAYFLRDLLLMPRSNEDDELAGRDDRPPPKSPASSAAKPAAMPADATVIADIRATLEMHNSKTENKRTEGDLLAFVARRLARPGKALLEDMDAKECDVALQILSPGPREPGAEG